eukprot:scaffold224286_cov17-Prasinocladus_malaysianus.AAC.1
MTVVEAACWTLRHQNAFIDDHYRILGLQQLPTGSKFPNLRNNDRQHTPPLISAHACKSTIIIGRTSLCNGNMAPDLNAKENNYAAEQRAHCDMTMAC